MPNHKIQKERIKKLVDKYNNLSEDDKKKINEAETISKFIRPLFESLGWDFEEDVYPEKDVSGKRVDLSFRINNVTKFFVEAKPIRANLDKEDYAKQAINYAYHKSVPYAILTDFEAIKIYTTEWDKPDIQSCQWFEIKAKDYLTDEKLAWLSKEAFEKGILDKEVDKAGRRPKTTIDKQLAKDLIKWREILFKSLSIYNKKIDKRKIAECVQTILNRLIFMRTLEDRGFEEQNLRALIRDWKEKKGIKTNELLFSLNKLFKKFSSYYNSGLFDDPSAVDFLGEKLEADDGDFLEVINELYKTKTGFRYNFADIPADIFGSIYEQYLGQIQQEHESDKKKSKRKSQGIYYTPRYIVDYIVQNTLGEVLKTKTPDEIKNLKILDPACGSGSFLITAYSKLIEHWQKEKFNKHHFKEGKLADLEKEFKKRANFELSSQNKQRILLDNIYGVDLDDEAVELAKLNLLSKTVGRRAKLPNIDHNIAVGNSLIDDSKISDKAFDWQKSFPEVFKKGGFDVIIGNPPYVRVDSLNKNDKEYWKTVFKTPKGKYDLYYLFVEKSIELLNNGGKLGFIIPNKFSVASSAKKLRELIVHSSTTCEFISVSKLKIFGDASNYPILLILTKGSDLKKVKIKSFYSEGDFLKNNYEDYHINKNVLSLLPSMVIPININQKQLSLIIKLLKSKRLSNFLKISEGLRIPPKFEDNSKNKHGIVKQYQFERYSQIKEGVYISEPDLKEVLSEKSERFKNCLKEKIIIAEDALNINATIDNGFNIPQGGVYFGVITNDKVSLKYVLALLNSKLFSFVYKTLFGGMHMGGGYLRYRSQFLGELPIIETTKKEQIKLAKLVDKITKQSKDLQKLDPILDDKEYNKIKKEIDETDKDIDGKVYGLYGLGEREIEVVEK